MISTHILDLNLGTPALGVSVQLEKKSGETWNQIAFDITNADGRILFQSANEPGIYRLNFQIEDYFKKFNVVPFFVVAPVVFQISDTTRKYHVPLLLSSYGYSAYRGS